MRLVQHGPDHAARGGAALTALTSTAGQTAARGSVAAAELRRPGHRVASHAGHSVAELLKIYARCLDG